MQTLLDREVLGNPASRWLIALATAALVAVVLTILKRIAIARLSRVTKRTATSYDVVLVRVIEDTRAATILAAGVALGVRTLELDGEAHRWTGRALFAVLALQAGFWLTHAVRLVFDRRAARKDAAPGHATLSAAFDFVSRFVVWAIVIISIMSNLGVEVSTLVAGLGIGGLAAALAVQNILGELVAAFSIYLDRPFDIGDSIQVDSFQGTVERIGWRSTHLRSISGEQIILANSDLAKSRIRNHARMNDRRVSFSIAVPYATANDKLERVPKMLREEIDRLDEVRFDRSHLISFAESSIVFETVYFVSSTDYLEFADRNQALLLAIHRRFEEEEIDFGLPTRGRG